MTSTINSLQELPQLATEIISKFQHKIILFEGEMGAGKTTLIKEIIAQMGSQDETSSPTFSIVNEYETEMGKVFHFDLYRIKSEMEAYDFGIEEYLGSGNYCFIEWPERIENLIPENHHVVKIIAQENQRTIIFV
ncbi:MAG TPA: tRNA (adenosine(37)-N6)-threonylcarbamoyltransferase complex ATPase subunit type 1 TsaE [Moheibacter sp.]|nr:tRNA (adenosine(37)-N6)-threonylcarbamoyltransferase complex ATPase subunit type 1 TsaE [Moheibacter sp.]